MSDKKKDVYYDTIAALINTDRKLRRDAKSQKKLIDDEIRSQT